MTIFAANVAAAAHPSFAANKKIGNLGGGSPSPKLQQIQPGFPPICAISAVHSLASAESASAADTREHFAETSPFQRRAPSLPPPQNVNLADLRERFARHFGRKSAKFATLMTYLYL